MNRTEFIATIRHLGWCCYQLAAGQPYNLEPTEDQRKSLLQGVEYALQNPGMSAEQNHDNWMQMKRSQGWVWGPVKDAERKTHPDLVPFSELPKVEADKDTMDCFMQEQARKIWEDIHEPCI